MSNGLMVTLQPEHRHYVVIDEKVVCPGKVPA